jgi:hypothetical protein
VRQVRPAYLALPAVPIPHYGLRGITIGQRVSQVELLAFLPLMFILSPINGTSVVF